MSEPAEPPTEPALPPLPEVSLSKSEATFDVPNLLLQAVAQGGLITHSVREGGAQQVELVTEVSWSDTPVDEHALVFRVQAQNQIRFAGARITVLNDETDLGDLHLAPSAPTTSEYLAQVGKRVMIRFDCSRHRREGGREAFKIARNWITLP